jgi:protein-disulfide isomerase-like protein with CxxC motif
VVAIDLGMCDVETGVCEVQIPVVNGARVIYVTDPICSACWVSEPAWRSVTARYGDVLEIEHVFGGLLPGWDGFVDAGAGIRQPSDVAHHWDEFASLTGQPINSAVWLTDPLDSSFPPSIAAIAVRLVAPALEENFLRRIREMLFLDARNIARPEVLAEAAEQIGVDMDAYRVVIADGTAQEQFLNDRARSRALGVRGFPTLFVEGAAGRLVLHGIFDADRLERAVLAVTGMDRRPHLVDVPEAVDRLGGGTTAEYVAALGWDEADTERALAAAGMVRVEAGGGAVWVR